MADETKPRDSRFFFAAGIAFSAAYVLFFVFTVPHYHRICGYAMTHAITAMHGHVLTLAGGGLNDLAFNKLYYPPLAWVAGAITLAAGATTAGGFHLASAVLTVAGGCAIAYTRRPDGETRYGALGLLVYLGLTGVIGFSRFASMDALFLLAAPLAFFFAGEWQHRGGARWALLCGVAVGTGMLAKWTFWIFVVVPLAAALWKRRTDRVGIVALVIGAAAAGGWWYAFFFSASEFGFYAGQTERGIADLAGNFGWYLSHLAADLLGLVGGFLLLVALSALAARRRFGVIALWLGGGVLLPIALLSPFQVAETRYLTGVFAALAYLVVLGLGEIVTDQRRWAWVFLLAGAFLVQGIDAVYGRAVFYGQSEGGIRGGRAAPFVGYRLTHLPVDDGAVENAVRSVWMKEVLPDGTDVLFLRLCNDFSQPVHLRLQFARAIQSNRWPPMGRFRRLLPPESHDVIGELEAMWENGAPPILVSGARCVDEVRERPSGDPYRDLLEWVEDHYAIVDQVDAGAVAYLLYAPRGD